jgi:hypothetical protein
MRIQTSFQIFGYPGLAILCFLIAAAGGVWLLFTIFFQDEKIKKKKKYDWEAVTAPFSGWQQIPPAAPENHPL